VHCDNAADRRLASEFLKRPLLNDDVGAVEDTIPRGLLPSSVARATLGMNNYSKTPLMPDTSPHYLDTAQILHDAVQGGNNASILADGGQMSASQVRHYIRLDKKLSTDTKTLCRKNPEITMGHARVLATLPGPKQRPVAREVIAKRWSVRYLEQFVRAPSPPEDHAYYEKLSESLSEQLGHPLVVLPDSNAPKNGEIRVRYFGYDDFDAVCSKMGIAFES